ncbi:MAG: hypothetical protein AAGA56_18560 [Myxococcota bacterium]
MAEETPAGGDVPQATVDFGPTKGLVVQTADRQSTFGLHVAAWTRLDIDVSLPEPRSTVSIPIARPAVEAAFLKRRLYLFLQPEFGTGDPRLLDFFVDGQLTDGVAVRAGLFRTPHTRALLTPIVQLQLTQRGPVVDEFQLGRDLGGMLFGTRGGFEYFVGVFNGSRVSDFADLDPVPMPVSRFVYNFFAPVAYDQVPAAGGVEPRPGLAVGVSAAYRVRNIPAEETTGGDVRREERSWHGGADLSVAGGPASLQVEGFVRGTRLMDGSPREDGGAYVQGGVFLWPHVAQLASRFGWIRRDDGQHFRSSEVGLNGYGNVGQTMLGHHLKATVVYAFSRPGTDLNRDTHRMTCQTQVWF